MQKDPQGSDLAKCKVAIVPWVAIRVPDDYKMATVAWDTLLKGDGLLPAGIFAPHNLAESNLARRAAVPAQAPPQVA